jgi:hypothetical protein
MAGVPSRLENGPVTSGCGFDPHGLRNINLERLGKMARQPGC